MEEVAANMAFNGLRIGQRLQVDIHDPKVRGLIQGGYLRIIWKGDGDATGVDSAVDPGRVDFVPAGRVGSGGAGKPAQTEAVDGAGEHQSGAEGVVGPSADD